ncbi:MAG: biotin--[acetyl-CoA-carboxylase] ligase [Synechococcales cyanobacterium C42_A2020_086]|jgi:BirA family biotin operon repressor/biotin-[acetyl-CoA-carboxylase] ligase|nr:biotin--[acetyl-CoA-carboxylase] ligase [Synechococcales cyanobacterium C42_A2020_086]
MVTFNRSLLDEKLGQLEQLPCALTSALDPGFLPLSLHWFDEVTSTNQVAWDLLRHGSGSGTVVIAQQQSTGRGQRGHSWSSPSGGLYLSLGLDLTMSATQGIELTLVSVCGVAAALRQVSIPVGIKWLNDLVVERRKLGGILTETRVQQGQIRQAVVGVGINWCNPVPPMGVNLQTLWESLPIHQSQSNFPLWPHSLEALAALVLVGLKYSLSRWQQESITALIPSYEALLVNRGQAFQWQGHSGTILGITAAGDLRVQLAASEGSSVLREVQLPPGSVSLGYNFDTFSV